MPEPDDSGSIRVDRTLSYFSGLFARLGIEWCVAGAVAANAYRDPRDTTDLDLVVHVPAQRYRAVVDTLAADGWNSYRRSPDNEDPDVLRLSHDRYFPTDLLFVKVAYQTEALRRARPVSSEAGSVKVLAPEDVVIHKLIADRHQDRADVQAILRAGSSMDRAYVERWAEEWGVLDRWHRALGEI